MPEIRPFLVIGFVDFKPVPRLEKIGHKRCKQADDRKHRIG
jgi:hypothetical protein